MLFQKCCYFFFWKRKKSSVWTFFFGKKKIKSFFVFTFFLIHIHTWIPCERDIETFPSLKIVLEKQQVAASFKKYFIFTSFSLVVVLPPRFFFFKFRTQILCIIYLNSKIRFYDFLRTLIFLSFLLVVYIGGGPLPPSLSVIYTCKIDVWIGLLGGFQNFNFTVTQFDFLQLSDRLLGFLKSDFKFR